jgi:hypothetical protein
VGARACGIWQAPLPDAVRKLDETVERFGCDEEGSHVFFRADDIGVPSDNFARLLALFMKHRAPLALAVVPAWTSGTRWKIMKKLSEPGKGLWSWHQHGWRHVNHELEGKKQEFGPARNSREIQKDLLAGRNKLENMMGDDFYPLFTPPWNRCQGIALDFIKQYGYHAISRSQPCRPPAPEGLKEVSVNVDLHTRKTIDSFTAWADFFQEIETALISGRCGFMIHHQLMNNAAFDFLDKALNCFKRSRKVRITGLPELISRNEQVLREPNGFDHGKQG